MVFSSLHRQLSVEAADLTFELLDLALERGVEDKTITRLEDVAQAEYMLRGVFDDLDHSDPRRFILSPGLMRP